MKKILAIGFACLLISQLASCKAADNQLINVISREDGSGTRGAFVELLGIEEKNDKGEKIDHTTLYAEITNNTAVMMTSVMSDRNSIGYISLGSLNEIVKTVKINGVTPSIDSIKDGSYPLARPFLIAVKDNLNPLAQDFIDFIVSKDGQTVVQDKGYAPIDAEKSFSGGKVSGKIVVAGSSSVTPVMESLKEAYLFHNPDAEIEIQQSDSTTGTNSAIEGICDIAMTSRALKDSEVEKGLSPITIAMDGIVIIVNHDNVVDEMTPEQVKDIYVGKTTSWSQLTTSD
ncbi:substrate-binding domain-containing protein [Scatolibacter rhodanostii]|uniref:substrate-binding domain-containing protein n=1 Tax=Scatolibacter rhodanostii TaxID=2014781 RepID=UPI000C067F60|nr:substrate-binding domain-containing protein [Scatolibacter rhodanostii]